MQFHLRYQVICDGQIKRFDEFWQTQRQPTKAIVESHWFYIGAPIKIETLVSTEVSDNNKIIVDMEV